MLQRLRLTPHERLELLVEPDLGLLQELHRRELVPLQVLRVLELRKVLVRREHLVVLREPHRKRLDLLAQLVPIEHLRRTSSILLLDLRLVLFHHRRLRLELHHPARFRRASRRDRFRGLAHRGLHLHHVLVDVVRANQRHPRRLLQHRAQTRQHPPRLLPANPRATLRRIRRRVRPTRSRLRSSPRASRRPSKPRRQPPPQLHRDHPQVLVAHHQETNNRQHPHPHHRPGNRKPGHQLPGPHNPDRPPAHPGQRPPVRDEHPQERAQRPRQHQRPQRPHPGLRHGTTRNLQPQHHPRKQHRNHDPKPHHAQQTITDMRPDRPRPVRRRLVHRIHRMGRRIAPIEAHEPHHQEQPHSPKHQPPHPPRQHHPLRRRLRPILHPIRARRSLRFRLCGHLPEIGKPPRSPAQLGQSERPDPPKEPGSPGSTPLPNQLQISPYGHPSE